MAGSLSLAVLRSASATLAIWLLSPAIVSAQSFDCSRAASASEIAICGSNELRRLDSAMGARFRARAAEDPDVRQVQRQWIRERDALCERNRLEACLAVTIQARASELSSPARAASFTLPPLPPSAMRPEPRREERAEPPPRPEPSREPDPPVRAAECESQIRAWYPNSGGNPNRAFNLAAFLRRHSSAANERAYANFAQCVSRQRSGAPSTYCGCEFSPGSGEMHRDFFEVKYGDCSSSMAGASTMWLADLRAAFDALTCFRKNGWRSD